MKQAFPDLSESTDSALSFLESAIDIEQDIIAEKDIEKALFKQSIKKAPGSDRLNFKALDLLWTWIKQELQH